MARIAHVPGPLYDFIDLNVVVDKELSISELRRTIVRNAQAQEERYTVILTSTEQLPSLDKKLGAVLNHRDLLSLVEEGSVKVLAAVAIGGGGIGDVRRIYDVRLSGEGRFEGLVASDQAIKIVERPEKNLANTDIDLLQGPLPELTQEHPEQLTRLTGVVRGMRRQHLTLVQQMAYIESFRSFVEILDDFSDPQCNAAMILEVLAQAAEALAVLHGAGIAHRDFKADAVVLSERAGLGPGAARWLVSRLPDAAGGLKAALLRHCVQARIYDYDTVARAGGEKDPSRTTSSSENARIENPRELARVFTESDQYPLGIAALRLLPDQWSEVKRVMSSGMAVAVPMKISLLRSALEKRRDHHAEVYSGLYGCDEATAGELIDLILRLIAFEPEERCQDMGALVKQLRRLQRRLPSESILGLIRTHPHLFEDAEELIASLTSEGRSGRQALRHPPSPPKPPRRLGLMVWVPVALGALGIYALMGPRDSAPSPQPMAVAEVSRTPTPPAPTEAVPERLNLALDRLDTEAIAALPSLNAGAQTTLTLPTKEGFDLPMAVSVADDERFTFTLTSGTRESRYGPTGLPVITVRETILSEHFANWCEASSQERIAQFIRRMPQDPAENGDTLRAQFTFCREAATRLLSVEVERLDPLTFSIAFDGVSIPTDEPRQLLCSTVNHVALTHTGAPIFEDCKSLGFKAKAAVEAPPQSAVAPKLPPQKPTRSFNLSIEDVNSDLFAVAKDISKLPLDSTVRLKINGVGEVEILKLKGGDIYYQGRNISVGSPTPYAALLKAIQGTVDGTDPL